MEAASPPKLARQKQPRRWPQALGALVAASGCAATTPAVEGPQGATRPEAAPKLAAAEPRRWVVENSEVWEVHSQQTGRDYELIVGLPPSFHEEPERQYPILYAMDGQWDFSLINSLTGGLRYDKAIPEFVLVGVAYGGQEPDYGKLRGEDYTPTRAHPEYADEPFGGDADKFLNFLVARVFPMMEERYRADPGQRMISGASLGGLVSLYAMFKRPDLFSAVIALSPAVGWDERFLFGLERSFREQHAQLPARVWMSVGDSEWAHFTQANREFFSQFADSDYGGKPFRTRVIEGERHAGNKPEAYNRALRFVFEPYAASQTPP